MKTIKELINTIPNLSNKEFGLVTGKVKERILSKKVPLYLESPMYKLKCPNCDSLDKIKWGKRNDMQRYKCKNCKKTFNSLSNTPLARLRKKELWLQYSKCIKEGMTVRQSAYEIGVSKNTTFRWRHRFLIKPNLIKAKILSGIIDFYDIYFKESFKGSRYIPEGERRNVCILNSIDRSNNIFDLTDVKLSGNILKNKIKEKVNEGAIIVGENNRILRKFCTQNNIKFKEYIESISSNTKSYKMNNLIEYCKRFEDWILNHFRGVATKYLKNYVAWFRGLNEFNSGIKPITILLRAKSVEKYRYQPLKLTDLISTL